MSVIINVCTPVVSHHTNSQVTRVTEVKLDDEALLVLAKAIEGVLTKRAIDPPSAQVCTCSRKWISHEKDCLSANTVGN
jgi:hypothetical protein